MEIKIAITASEGKDGEEGRGKVESVTLDHFFIQKTFVSHHTLAHYYAALAGYIAR
jgi:hypothetical protein